MRLLAIVLASLVLLCSSAFAADRPVLEIPEIVKKVHRAVIRVQGFDVGQFTANADNPGGGSGFVFEIDYDKGIAYALTNVHVSGKAAGIHVTFWDDAIYRAELVAPEPGIDVALIRILGIPDERDLPLEKRTIHAVVLGDSDQVQHGELGLAMGCPGAEDAILVDRSNPYDHFLLNQTATANVVNGRYTPLEFFVGIWDQGRNMFGWQYGTNFDYTFQITTAINGGNSGGPLFNKHGEVIGINFYGGSWYISQDTNFAIPINLAKDFAFQVLETGKFEKPWTGMDIVFPPQMTDGGRYQEFIERQRPDHLEIFGVRKGSNAEAAGLRAGDIIIDINGQKFETPEEVRLFVFSCDIGDVLSVRIVRDGKRMADPVLVTVGAKRSHDAEFSV